LIFVNVVRILTAAGAYPRTHPLGNEVLTRIVQLIFGRESSGVLSGYKAFSRRFVKSFPALSSGFEVETELTVHALELRMPIGEIRASYKERPPGSMSKLRTYRDGLRLFILIARLVKNGRPLHFFGLLGCVLVGIGVVLGIPLIVTFINTGLVPPFPDCHPEHWSRVAGLSIFAGLILDLITKTRRELKRFVYLQIPPVRGD
jgi:hypothetical protein